jgi:hypothetical protein
MYSPVLSAPRTPPSRATVPRTTSNASGRPVAWSVTRSSVATLPRRMGLK